MNMAQYDVIPCYEDEDMFDDRTDNVTDLHAYYMSQFNLELENSNRNKKADSFKYGAEESFDFEVLDSWSTPTSTENEFGIIDEVIDNNISEQNIKEVLLDLDSIDFEDKSYKIDTCKAQDNKLYEANNDYIDDESLLDELCREDTESCRLTPDFNEEYFSSDTTEKNILPSIDTVLSKRYCNYNIEENQIQDYNVPVQQTVAPINNLEHYSYPNNILYNLEEKKYVLPDTPTSCTEFSFDRNERKISVSESIESDIHSSSYYDENSENFDEDDLFVNLDDFGLTFETDANVVTNEVKGQPTRKVDKEKSQGNHKNIFLIKIQLQYIILANHMCCITTLLHHSLFSGFCFGITECILHQCISR